jgi:hypothetical protein
LTARSGLLSIAPNLGQCDSNVQANVPAARVASMRGASAGSGGSPNASPALAVCVDSLTRCARALACDAQLTAVDVSHNLPAAQLGVYFPLRAAPALRLSATGLTDDDCQVCADAATATTAKSLRAQRAPLRPQTRGAQALMAAWGALAVVATVAALGDHGAHASGTARATASALNTTAATLMHADTVVAPPDERIAAFAPSVNGSAQTAGVERLGANLHSAFNNQHPGERDELALPPVTYGRWQGTGYGAYLTPTALDVASDGGVDVLLHLNGALMADTDWRESRANAIVVSVAIAAVVGSAGYARKFASPSYLTWVLRETFATMRKNGDRRALHVRRLGVVSWSAGFGAVGQILSQPEWASKIDAVVLLDSLHGSYADPKNGMFRMPNPAQPAMGLGEPWVDRRGLAKYVQLAKDAVAGTRAFVVSHASILPPDYASCNETANAILNVAGIPKHSAADLGAVSNSKGMLFTYRADQGDLHFQGFQGGGPHDHFDQLHLVGDAIRHFVAPRWNRRARTENAAQLRADLTTP